MSSTQHVSNPADDVAITVTRRQVLAACKGLVAILTYMAVVVTVGANFPEVSVFGVSASVFYLAASITSLSLAYLTISGDNHRLALAFFGFTFFAAWASWGFLHPHP